MGKNSPPPAVNHDLEVLDRLTAVRDLIDAILGGRINYDIHLVGALEGLLTSARWHAWAADFERHL